MKWRKSERCCNIAEWLMIATKDLCEQAKSRVTLEIEAHYKEAVEVHLAIEESQPGAEAKALEELGDPNKAARRFRRMHLTKKEAKKLKSIETAARKPPDILSIVGIVFIALALVCSLFALRQKASGWTFADIFMPVLLLLMQLQYFCRWISFLLVRALPSKRALRRIFLLQPINEVFSVSVLVCSICYLSHCSFIYGILMFHLLYANSLRSWLRTWQKAKNDFCM
jgi:hypothetical protein